MKRLTSGSATIALAVAFVLTAAACSPQQTDSPPERVESETVRLYVFDCGTLQAEPARFRLKKEEVSTTNLSVPCFMVAHPQGRLMWDPGAVPDADWTPTGAVVAHHLVLPDGGERDLMLRKPLMTQLADIGTQRRISRTSHSRTITMITPPMRTCLQAPLGWCDR